MEGAFGVCRLIWEFKRKEGDSPYADFYIAQTRCSDAGIANANNRSRTTLNLTLGGAIEQQIRSRPIFEKRLHIARWVEGGIVIAGQSKRHIDCLISIIGAINTVIIITRAAFGDFPIRV